MSKLFITIDDPCGQNWDEMTPAENGRFCGHCTKEVIDFSTSSDNEVIAFIERNKGKLLCGNFEPGQLNRWMESSSVNTTNPLLYKILAGMFLLTASQNSMAQQTGKVLPDTVLLHPKACGDSLEIPTAPKTLSNVFDTGHIRIRGLLSFTGNKDSLLVVDGTPIPISWLKKLPADKIKNKTTLKASTAAAIYGPEGANGVTIVTTNFTKRQWRKFFRKGNT